MDGQSWSAEAMVEPLAVDPPGGSRPSHLARLLHLDELLLLGMRRLHAPWRTRLARALTRLGNGSSWTLLSLALLASGSALGVHLGARIGLAAALATLLSQPLKRSLLRPRPSRTIVGFAPLAADPDAFSFPSGHAAAAFAVAIALAGEPFGLGPLCLALAAAIGLSRVYLGAHYPLDVAAGSGLGIAAGLLARLLLR